MDGAARCDAEHRYDAGASALRDAPAEDVEGVLPGRQVEKNPGRNKEHQILRAEHVLWRVDYSSKTEGDARDSRGNRSRSTCDAGRAGRDCAAVLRRTTRTDGGRQAIASGRS